MFGARWVKSRMRACDCWYCPCETVSKSIICELGWEKRCSGFDEREGIIQQSCGESGEGQAKRLQNDCVSPAEGLKLM